MNKRHYIIAEIAQAHEGSLGIAHSYIDSLAKTGVDAIKFQTHIADAESSIYEPFRINFSYEDKCRMDYWRRMEFSLDQWVGLKKHCDEVGVEFMSSPFSNEAVELLEKVGVSRYKIGSGEVNNLLLLEKIAQTGKPVILSSGMSSLEELDKSVKFLKERDIIVELLQCTTSYPTSPEQWGLNVIDVLSKRYNIPIGFSDHSGEIFAPLFAAVLGAKTLEVHAVFDKDIFGPDSKSSLNINQIQTLVNGIRQLERSLACLVDKTANTSFYELKRIFEKSLCINKDLNEGHIIKFEDLDSKKPKGKGLPSSEYNNVIGKKLKVNKKQWEFLNLNDLYD